MINCNWDCAAQVQNTFEKEFSMRICYLIMIHHKFHQFQWLFNSIYNEADYFLINIEKNASDQFCSDVQNFLPKKENIRFLPQMHCGWGSFSLCRGILAGIREALAWCPEWSYLINLSGQCYPLKDRAERVADLSSTPHRNYVELLHFPTMPQKIRRHVERRLYIYYIELGGKIRNTHIPRAREESVAIEYYGSDWFMLSRRFCDWAISNPYLDSLLQALRFAKLPSEMMMQYLVTRDEFSRTVAPHYLREIVWSDWKLHPELLTISYKERLLRSPAHFARKFDAGSDDEILHLLAERVGAAPPCASS